MKPVVVGHCLLRNLFARGISLLSSVALNCPSGYQRHFALSYLVSYWKAWPVVMRLISIMLLISVKASHWMSDVSRVSSRDAKYSGPRSSMHLFSMPFGDWWGVLFA